MRRIYYSPSTVVKVPNIFGTGEDGDYVATTNDVIGRDMNFRNLTVPAGCTLNTSGWRICVSGTLTNLGHIHNDGGDANVNVGGAAGSTGNGCPAVDGASGLTSVGPGFDTYQSGIAFNNSSGVGGNGGTVGGSPGGSSAQLGSSTLFEPSWFDNVISAMTIFDFNATSTSTLMAGQGGGSGAFGTGAVGSSGGGGGGGGLVWISAKQVNNGSGIISANGGKGGNASGTGNIAGGGGGGGGRIFIIALTINRGTITANGGTGGTKVGTGNPGNPGIAGSVFLIPGV
jgi:hypothetical protein